MVKLIFEDLEPNLAMELAKWYGGQGEQDADLWLGEHGLSAPIAKEIFLDDEKNVHVVMV